MDYYPGIAEDDDFDDTTSCGSAEDISLQPGGSRMRHSIQSTSATKRTAEENDDYDNDDYVDDLIENERYRRLGTRGNNNTKVNNNRMLPPPPPRRLSSELSNTSSNNPGGVLGNIRGWFGGQGGGAAVAAAPHYSSDQAKKYPPNNNHQSYALPVGQSYNNNLHLTQNASLSEDDSSSSFDNDTSSDEDSESSSQSSNCDNNDNRERNNNNNSKADLTPQERARARALRYLSDSCVDAGRKAKTSSYVWGLERLDLKRKRDRYEKELEIVEAEMNKDRGLLIHNTCSSSSSSSNERDAIWTMAGILVSEVPRQGNADAGAGGSDYVNNGREERFMKYDDYSDNIWENKDAVIVYASSLQSRLKDAQERTRSLEKRLAVLEQAGDDIISSLCEDLADVTGQSNKVEAKYVKKGKELQRKRRREELLYRKKIKQAELRVQKLEERLTMISGGHTKCIDDQIICANDSDTTSNQDSTGFENDDEYDEVMLEKKLSTIKARYEEDKNQHMIEVESIRRQCEQLKLRLSVARLVMEGEDNLRDYIRLLEDQQKKTVKNDFIDQEDFSVDKDDYSIIPIPPSHITRARAMLLKIGHLECIYEQRLSVSKAFTDATINALDQELIERESASQKMEVRCLNELLLIELEIKDIIQEGKDKLDMLDAEAQELDDAVAACVAQNEIANIGDMFGDTNYCSEAVEHGKDMAVEIDDDDASSSCSIPREEIEEKQRIYVSDSPETADPVSELQIESKMDDDTINMLSSPLDSCPNSSDDIENIVNDCVKENSVDSELNKINKDMSQLSQTANCGSSDVIILGLNETEEAPVHGTANKLVETNILTSEESMVDEYYSISQGSPLANNENGTESEFSNIRDEKVDIDPTVEPCDAAIVISNVVDAQKRIELESLAHELNSTHADYLSAYAASTSSDRVKQLNHMNDLVVAIANLSGLKMESSDETAVVEERQLVSWSYKKSHRKSSEKDRKHKSKKRQHRNKDNDLKTKDELIRYLKAN